MADRPPEPPGRPDTLGLSTTLEEGFVSPLTAIRGALEILRDYPDIEPGRRRDFLDQALSECTRLQRSIDDLATTVYAAARGAPEPPAGEHADRIRLDAGTGIVDLDFSDFVFSSSELVNAVFDEIEDAVDPTGRKWFFLVNHRSTSVWPEAWIAYAHRGKRLATNYGLGSVRYAEPQAEGDSTLPTRDEALSQVEEMRSG